VFGKGATVDERFARILAQVEAAKQDLVESVPSPRGVPVRPMADALSAFEDGLRRAADGLARWTPSEVELRQACRAAVEEALRRAERVRLDAPPLDYESLVEVLGDLMTPLEVFERVEASLRRRG
jgi:hypothetical protein